MKKLINTYFPKINEISTDVNFFITVLEIDDSLELGKFIGIVSTFVKNKLETIKKDKIANITSIIGNILISVFNSSLSGKKFIIYPTIFVCYT